MGSRWGSWPTPLRTATAQRLDSIVLPAIGQLQLRECTVGRMDSFFALLSEQGLSAETRRGVRTVVSGVLRQAVLHEALAANPVRELGRIRGKPSKPRALTPDERRRWLQFLATDPATVRRDLHDLTVFILGTGVRIGEALALRERDIDLEGGLIVVGMRAKKVPGGEEIRSVCPVPLDKKMINRY